MTLTLYGIPNCDTVKRARVRLEEHGVAFVFHDFKKKGIDEGVIDRWFASLEWSTLLNQAGTTFRKLPEEAKADLDPVKARALMIAYPSVIKRPVLEGLGVLMVGYKPGDYDRLA